MQVEGKDIVRSQNPLQNRLISAWVGTLKSNVDPISSGVEKRERREEKRKRTGRGRPSLFPEVGERSVEE